MFYEASFFFIVATANGLVSGTIIRLDARLWNLVNWVNKESLMTTLSLSTAKEFLNIQFDKVSTSDLRVIFSILRGFAYNF